MTVEVAIELEHDRPYQPGDAVRGTVRVSNDAALRLNRLLLDLHWELRSEGAGANGARHHTTLAKGQLEPGEHALPFELRAPTGPASYHGELVQLLWVIDAHVDAGSRREASATCELRLVDGPGLKPDRTPHQELPASVEEDVQQGRLGRRVPELILGPPFFLGGAAVCVLAVSMIIALFRGDLTDEPLGPLGSALMLGGFAVSFLIAGLFALVGGSMCHGLLRAAPELTKLGPVRLSVPRTEVHPGGAMEASIEFTPRRDVRVGALRARLFAREFYWRESSENRVLIERALFSDEQVLMEDVLVPAGEPAQFEVRAAIPESLPYTFDGATAGVELTWKMELHLGGTPLEREVKLRVSPGPRS